MEPTIAVLDDYARGAAERVGAAFDGAGSLILTGGTTAASIYSHLPPPAISSAHDILFSDERCVPPSDEASNYGMAARLLPLDPGGARVHRMRGEDEPARAAAAYHDAITSVVSAGIDVALLGVGSDCHIAALFPGSEALEPGEALCLAVERPDGMTGLTLTPRALAAAAVVVVVADGPDKADAVRRLVNGNEEPRDCPARLLATHPRLHLLLDSASSALL